MKEKLLSYRYGVIKRTYPFAGHYLILSGAVRGMKYNKSKITKAFNIYVHKSDYATDERDMLLENLWRVSFEDYCPKLPLFLAMSKN